MVWVTGEAGWSRLCLLPEQGGHVHNAGAPRAARGNSNVARSTHSPLQKSPRTKVPQEQLCYGMEILQGISGPLKKIKLNRYQLVRCFGEFTRTCTLHPAPTHCPGNAGACSVVHIPPLGFGTSKGRVHSPQAHNGEMRAGWPGRSPRSHPAVCCVFLLVKEVAGPHPGMDLDMSQGMKFL